MVSSFAWSDRPVAASRRLCGIIAGLIEPSTGEVRWSAEVPADHREQIGFVFQEPTLMPWAEWRTTSGCHCASRNVQERGPRAY